MRKTLLNYWHNLSSRERILIGITGIVITVFVIISAVEQVELHDKLIVKLATQQQTLVWMQKSAVEVKFLSKLNENRKNIGFTDKIKAIYAAHGLTNVEYQQLNVHTLKVSSNSIKFSNLYQTLVELENKWLIQIKSAYIKYLTGNTVTMDIIFTHNVL